MSMDRRINFHKILVSAYERAYPDAKKAYVYFQPPSNIKMTYPCIVYSRDSADTMFANDQVWHYTQRYQVIIIDAKPDTPILDQLRELPMSLYERHYVADNLNHDVFNIYY